jgi:glucose/galactose transporter
MGICNKIAGALSPLILGAIVLEGAAQIESNIGNAASPEIRTELLNQLAQRVVMPYSVMAVVLFLLAFMIWRSSLPEIEATDDKYADNAKKADSLFQFPHLWLGVLCIFLYVGAEVMAGDVIGPYGKAIGISLDETKIFTSYTLWSMVAGYVLGILTIPKYIKQQNALALSAIAGLLLSLGFFFSSGYTSIVFIALLGFANALMWPAIFPLAIDGLGKFTKIGAALLIMGIAGGAVLPLVYGWLTTQTTPSTAFFSIVAPCYAYILFFALKGHTIGKQVS